MKKTVKQVSKELGISKPAVTQRMNAIKNFRANYTHKIGNHLEINERGVDLLTSHNSEYHKLKTISGNKNSKKGKQVDAIYLMRQIMIKDKQIDNLQTSLDKQQTLLDQQQQLQLTTVTENRKLKEEVYKLSGLIETSKRHEKVDKTNNSENQVSKNKVIKNWWKFWKNN